MTVAEILATIEEEGKETSMKADMVQFRRLVGKYNTLKDELSQTATEYNEARCRIHQIREQQKALRPQIYAALTDVLFI
jgi:chromosome segregation ATPase